MITDLFEMLKAFVENWCNKSIEKRGFRAVLLIMPILFPIVISLSQWLIFLVIGGLICGVLCKGFFGGSGVSAPIGGSTSTTDSESSNYGKLYDVLPVTTFEEIMAYGKGRTLSYR